MEELSKKCLEESIALAKEKQESPSIECNKLWCERRKLGYITGLAKHGEGYKNFKPRLGSDFQIDEARIESLGKESLDLKTPSQDKADSELVEKVEVRKSVDLPLGSHWVEIRTDDGQMIRYISELGADSTPPPIYDGGETDGESEIPMKKRSYFRRKEN